MKLTSTLLSFAALSALAVVPAVSADIYMHNPPGSNNFLDETTTANNDGRNVLNNARLFDSQDNNRGGYRVGSVGTGAARVVTPLKFYTGSQIPIQWTNQHACGGAQDNCDIIIQYMVAEANQANGVKALRDGTTTTIMPANGDADPQYGRHESRAYFDECTNTLRDAGLFFADQAANAAVGRRSTRQNNNGNQRGNECPEERDYYPTAVPNPWRDAAIITNDVSKCAAVKTLSQNVAATYKCNVAGANKPITQAACQAKGGQWQTIAPKGIPAPECIKNTAEARDNSLGVVAGQNGTMASYMFTVPPEVAGKEFVIRIRYNISTGEFFDPTTGARAAGLNNIDYKYNSAAAGQATTVPVHVELGIANKAEATARGYTMANNPNTDVFGALLAKQGIVVTQQAFALNQFGRTFEDRSHVMLGLDSSKEPVVAAALAAGKKVLNINVMGEGGNLAQTYPKVQLQFSQSQYNAQPGDVAVVQWTLSDRLPTLNSDVPGAKQSQDTANFVMLANPTYDRMNAIPASEGGNPFQCGAPGRNQPATFVDQSSSLFGLPIAKVADLAKVQSTYFSGPIPLTNECVYAVASTTSVPGTGLATLKATIAVEGPKLNEFKQKAVVKLNALRAANKIADAVPVFNSFQSMTQLSAQTISPQNPYSFQAQQTISKAFATTETSSKSSTPIGMYIGIAAGVAVLLVLIVVAYVIYSKKLAASTTASKAPQVYQVKQSAPMATAQGRTTPSRSATGTSQSFKPVGVQSTQQMTAQSQGKPTAQKQWQSDRARVQANYV